MILSFGWTATFLDARRRIVLSKPGTSNTRRLYMEYKPPFVRRIDPKSGVALVDTFNRLPMQTHKQLVTACRERWGPE
jgi:hypothetical protein